MSPPAVRAVTLTFPPTQGLWMPMTDFHFPGKGTSFTEGEMVTKEFLLLFFIHLTIKVHFYNTVEST